MGLVISPMVRYRYKDGTSIKLCVHPDYEGADFNKPISFTCDGKFINIDLKKFLTLKVNKNLAFSVLV